MTDEKDKNMDNVICGPWGSDPITQDKKTSNWIKQKYDRELDKNNSQLQMKEKLAKIDLLTENVMVQMIHTFQENGYQIDDEQFILDVGFLSEVIKGALSRQEGLPHVIQGFIEQIMSPEKKENEEGVTLHYSRFDSPLLADVIEMVSEVIEGDDEVDVEFKSDMKEDKDTLHSKRNKELIKDEEKEDDDK